LITPDRRPLQAHFDEKTQQSVERLSQSDRVCLREAIKAHKRSNQRGHLIQRNHVRPVRGRGIGGLMGLDEHGRNAQ